jgi:hypothetical protein
MRLGINTENLCIKVYDPRYKQVIAEYDTYRKAEQELGISSALIRKKVQDKTRVFVPKLNLQVALRLSTKK